MHHNCSVGHPVTSDTHNPLSFSAMGNGRRRGRPQVLEGQAGLAAATSEIVQQMIQAQREGRNINLNE